MTESSANLLASMFRTRLREHAPAFAELERELAGTKPLVLQNLHGSALPFVVAELAARVRRPFLILTASIERAEQVVDDLEFFGAPQPLHYPKWEVLPYDEEELSLEVAAKQTDVFEALAKMRGQERRGLAPASSVPVPAFPGAFPVIVAPIDAMMQRVLPPGESDALAVRLEWGDRVDTAKLAESLSRAGYERVPVVESRGEFSIRGGIVDIYSPNAEEPIRIDLFGDEIESIRKFDISTQRSREALGTDAKISIPLARPKAAVGAHIAAKRELVPFFDLLPPETVVILDTPERFEEVCHFFESAVERQYRDVLHASPELPAPESLLIPGAHLYRHIEKFRRVEHSLLPVQSSDKTVRHVAFHNAGYPTNAGDLEAWLTTMKKHQSGDFLVVVVCDNDGQVQRFDEMLREHEIGARAVFENGEGLADLKPRDVLSGYQDIILMVGGLHGGFALHDARVAFLTDREIFGRYKRRHVYRKIYKGRPIASSDEIQRGDYVVHVDHGIAKYLGMRQQEIDGRTVDLLELLYADNDKLLVPVDKIRCVQKYASSESDAPSLDKLGSGRWQKRRKKSNEEVEKLAGELLKLYAKREVAGRKPYGPDTAWQAEFESSFLYRETPDQMKAIVDAKADMERTRPMDRLLCGDVGYGKTEVAIRTVFKCVQAGRQAAILCPTTILAQQHWHTFRERFAEYPIKIGMLSRFQTPKEAKDVVCGAKTGEIQVVVGTHRLLSTDVQFLDLGLLVVDEEQRFGVKAKEKLKELRAEVDILTLTATPIPRTLHMALAGLRDLSTITTPPPDRHPIRTKIINFDADQIAEAILRELNRGGQVFFVHNRIHNIQEISKRLQEIVPHARIAVAHGQMNEHELEDVMVQFVDHKFDILVSTSIIESGLDIPNANTIIVNRADAFGLAQLYQLRGRVGREKRRAYAYLIVPQGQAITDQAVKRLAAIEEFTELGVGFNIAMRDMEIRGTGNILGKEQHGTITEIGFELYCEMLEDAVHRLKGEDIHDTNDVEIKWPVSSFIPAGYIPVESQRVTFYKRLAAARTDADAADLEAELRDRYGELPEPVRALLAITRLRLVAGRLRIAGINVAGARVRLGLVAPEAHAWREDIKEAMKTATGVASVEPTGADAIVVMLKPGDALSQIAAVTGLLRGCEAAGV